MEIEFSEDISNHEELIPQIIKRIFAICRNDDHFALKDDIQQLSDDHKELQKKLNSKESMLAQSREVKKDLLRRISVLEHDNESLKSQLLEEMGSEE
jgi:hypothetical protein